MKLAVEFIGSFLFMLAIGLVVAQEVPMAPLVIGFSLMVAVYAGGHISGAHYNPAVSLAIMLRGKMTPAEMVSYWVAQILGALMAFLVAGWIAGKSVGIAPGEGIEVSKALAVELLYTFMLAFVVLNVATAKGTQGNSFYGLAIGGTIVVAAFAGGAISGGAFNPAVGIGATLSHAMMGGGGFENLWLYLVGPLVGGALAGVVFKGLGTE